MLTFRLIAHYHCAIFKPVESIDSSFVFEIWRLLGEGKPKEYSSWLFVDINKKYYTEVIGQLWRFLR